jgi:hypothetical protein
MQRSGAPVFLFLILLQLPLSAQGLAGVHFDTLVCAEERPLAVPNEAGAQYDFLPPELVTPKYGGLVARTFLLLKQMPFYNPPDGGLRVVDIALRHFPAPCGNLPSEQKLNTDQMSLIAGDLKKAQSRARWYYKVLRTLLLAITLGQKDLNEIKLMASLDRLSRSNPPLCSAGMVIPAQAAFACISLLNDPKLPPLQLAKALQTTNQYSYAVVYRVVVLTGLTASPPRRSEEE